MLPCSLAVAKTRCCSAQSVAPAIKASCAGAVRAAVMAVFSDTEDCSHRTMSEDVSLNLSAASSN